MYDTIREEAQNRFDSSISAIEMMSEEALNAASRAVDMTIEYREKIEEYVDKYIESMNDRKKLNVFLNQYREQQAVTTDMRKFVWCKLQRHLAEIMPDRNDPMVAAYDRAIEQYAVDTLYEKFINFII